MRIEECAEILWHDFRWYSDGANLIAYAKKHNEILFQRHSSGALLYFIAILKKRSAIIQLLNDDMVKAHHDQFKLVKQPSLAFLSESFKCCVSLEQTNLSNLVFLLTDECCAFITIDVLRKYDSDRHPLLSGASIEHVVFYKDLATIQKDQLSGLTEGFGSYLKKEIEQDNMICYPSIVAAQSSYDRSFDGVVAIASQDMAFQKLSIWRALWIYEYNANRDSLILRWLLKSKIKMTTGFVDAVLDHSIVWESCVFNEKFQLQLFDLFVQRPEFMLAPSIMRRLTCAFDDENQQSYAVKTALVALIMLNDLNKKALLTLLQNQHKLRSHGAIIAALSEVYTDFSGDCMNASGWYYLARSTAVVQHALLSFFCDYPAVYQSDQVQQALNIAVGNEKKSIMIMLHESLSPPELKFYKEVFQSPKVPTLFAPAAAPAHIGGNGSGCDNDGSHVKKARYG